MLLYTYPLFAGLDSFVYSRNILSGLDHTMRAIAGHYATIVPMLRTLIAILALVTASCGGGDSSPTSATRPFGEFSQTDIRVGTGADAVAGRRLSVHYTGWLYDPARTESKGSQFDTSVGRAPFAFTLGIGQVIRGWDQGAAGMKVGGLRRLVLPPELAYGTGGSPPAIPPNATLIFEIELLEVQ